MRHCRRDRSRAGQLQGHDRAHPLVQAAALTFARALREHLAEGLARGQLETVISGVRCLEHLVGLVGPTAAAHAFRQACQEPPAGA
jgi:hypothetical protein